MRLRNLFGFGLAVAIASACSASEEAVFAVSESADASATEPAADESPSVGAFGEASAQGDGGEQCAATVAKIEKPKVDIIFVIDDSGSMTEEMDQIKTNVNSFAQKISTVGLDYHVVFITRRATSPTQAGYVCVPQPLAGPNCADRLPTFVHVNQDVQSSDSLQRILATYDSSNPALAWNKHLRYESTKIFVEVSDDGSAIRDTVFDQQLLAKQPAGMFGTAQARKYVFHSIVSKPATEPIPSTKICSTAAGASVDYQRLSKLTGGVVDEVCKTSYAAVLDKIAKNVTDRLGCELAYPATQAADPTKVVVQFTPVNGTTADLKQVSDPSKCAAVPDGWFYDDNANPSRIVLCPSMCKAANAGKGSKLEALVGCKAPDPS